MQLQASANVLKTPLVAPTAVQPEPFSGQSIQGRDVVLINPFGLGGGDHGLANKVANIALQEHCRVTVVPLNVRDISAPPAHRNLNQTYKKHEISELHNPLFIIAPVGILPTEKLKHQIEQLCSEYNFAKTDVMLIEEMDLAVGPSQQMSKRVEMLQDAGFKSISPQKLGFAEGAIGYLPVDPAAAELVKERAKGELTKLLDGYNQSLNPKDNVHLAYISSNSNVTNSQKFIANTLVDTLADGKDTHYVMVLRNFDEHAQTTLPKVLTETFNSKHDDYDYPALFSKAAIYFADPDSGKPLLKAELEGTGARQVNIFFTGQLPHNLFMDLMSVSHSGMASGDQSLGEFLSLTGKMPYYDTQPWKKPLAHAILSRAYEQGGDGVESELSRRLFGSTPKARKPLPELPPNLNQPQRSGALDYFVGELNEEISAIKADVPIRSFIRNAKG